MESPSGNVGLNSGAFPHMAELLERANEIVASNPGFLDFVSQLWRKYYFKTGFKADQIVACPITGVTPCLCRC